MTTGIFLAIFLPVSLFIGTILVALIILLLQDTRNTNNALTRIEDTLKPITEIDHWIRKRGLETILSPEGGEISHSLPPIEAARRDYLVERGRDYGLTEAEATELQDLLQKDARNDLATGALTFLAFLGIMAGIIAIINALSQKK